MGRSIVSDPLGVGHPILNRNRHIVKYIFFDDRGLDSVEIANNKFKAWQL